MRVLLDEEAGMEHGGEFSSAARVSAVGATERGLHATVTESGGKTGSGIWKGPFLRSTYRKE